MPCGIGFGRLSGPFVRGAALGGVGAGLLIVGACGGGGTLTGAGGGGPLGHGGGIVLTGSAGATGTGTAGITGMDCAARPIPLQRVPPDILIVVDTSASMNDAADGSCAGGCGAGSKWAAAVSGIDSVAGSTSNDIKWGLKLLAGGSDACDTGGIAVTAGLGQGAIIAGQLANRTVADNLTVTG